MFVSFRTTIVTLAALVPASVAPAQVVSADLQAVSMAPAMMFAAATEIPKIVTPTLIDPPAAAAEIPAPVVEDEKSPAPEIRKFPGESLAAMVSRLGESEVASREHNCLATAIYFEAKSEPLAGQLAVGEVLANRIKSGRFASSYCGVVMQRGQFSFVRNRTLPSVPKSGRQWKNAVAIAAIVDGKLMNSQAPRALFFHAKRVSPGWKATRIATIGNHLFYR